MAEKKAAGKDGEPAAEGAGNKKKLILIAAGGVLVLVLAIVLGVVLIGGNGDEEDEEAAAEEVHAPPALYVALGPKFVVTLPGEGKPHYFQVSISALTREQAVVDELNFNAPLLRDRITSLLAQQEFERLRTEEGKLALRDEVLKTVQGIVAEALAQGEASAPKDDDEEDSETKSKAAKKKKGKAAEDEESHAAGVEQIFFTEFVLQ